MRFAHQLAAGLLIGLLLVPLGAGCAARLQVGFDPETDFSGYRTWGWQPRDASARREGPSALDVQLARQIRSALLVRGLQYADYAPDLLVSARLVITPETVTENTTPAVRVLSTMHHGGSYEIQVTESVVRDYERGRLTVAVTDAKQSRQVWRGEVEGRYEDPFRLHLEEVLARLVDRFPMCGDPQTRAEPSTVATAGEAGARPSAWPER